MGGRGAASGLDPYRGRDGKLFRYGDEYKTLWQDGNVKYVTPRDPNDNPRVPQITRTPNREYVLVGKDGGLKSICHYDSQGKLDCQIDLDHYHKGMKPHAHDGFDHGEGRPVTEAEQRTIDHVSKRWREHNNGK